MHEERWSIVANCHFSILFTHTTLQPNRNANSVRKGFCNLGTGVLLKLNNVLHWNILKLVTNFNLDVYTFHLICGIHHLLSTMTTIVEILLMGHYDGTAKNLTEFGTHHRLGKCGQDISLDDKQRIIPMKNANKNCCSSVFYCFFCWCTDYNKRSTNVLFCWTEMCRLNIFGSRVKSILFP